MTKESEMNLAETAKNLADAKRRKAEAEDAVKACEKAFKDAFKKENIMTYTFGNGYTVEIQKVAGSMIVDTDKLKAAGLFDKYSKPKSGSVQVRISNPDDEFLAGLNERRQKHIEESKNAKA
jgi:hypothetical protein